MILSRVAAFLIIVSQLILLSLLAETNGGTAILFSFVGTPMLGLGLLLALFVIIRRKREESGG